MTYSKSFWHVLCRYDELATELEEYSDKKIPYRKARLIIRNKLNLRWVVGLLFRLRLMPQRQAQQ